MAEKLAANLLAISGRQAISDLYDAASTAFGLGKLDVALVEIAEAAERVSRGARAGGAAASAGSDPFTARKPRG